MRRSMERSTRPLSLRVAATGNVAQTSPAHAPLRPAKACPHREGGEARPRLNRCLLGMSVDDKGPQKWQRISTYSPEIRDPLTILRGWLCCAQTAVLVRFRAQG